MGSHSARVSSPVHACQSDFTYTDVCVWLKVRLMKGSYVKPSLLDFVFFFHGLSTILCLFLFLSSVLTKRRSWSISLCSQLTLGSQTSSQNPLVYHFAWLERRRRNMILRRGNANCLRAIRSPFFIQFLPFLLIFLSFLFSLHLVLNMTLAFTFICKFFVGQL